MRPCTAAPLPCMTAGYLAGRDPVRAPMVASLPWCAGLTSVLLCTDADTGHLGSGDSHAEGGWHPQQAAVPAVRDSNAQ
jgi:hypothetical protein